VQAGKSSVKKAVEDSLELIDYKFDANVTKVLIKPNMCYYWDYSTGHTTDPKLVAALIELLREKISSNVDISVVEADASAMKCTHAFKFLGYEKLANQYDVNLVNLSKTEAEPVKIEAGSIKFTLMLPLIVRNADLRINVPKIKYMSQTKISCSLKNIFGANPYPSKYKYHPILNQTIVAVNKLMQFHLHILDGIIVTGKPPTLLDLIMASQDPVALDSAASKIAGVNPHTVRHITLAHKEGLGNISYIAKGANPKQFEKRYPKMKPSTKILNTAYKLATQTGLLET